MSNLDQFPTLTKLVHDKTYIIIKPGDLEKAQEALAPILSEHEDLELVVEKIRVAPGNGDESFVLALSPNRDDFEFRRDENKALNIAGIEKFFANRTSLDFTNYYGGISISLASFFRERDQEAALSIKEIIARAGERFDVAIYSWSGRQSEGAQRFVTNRLG